MLHVRDIMTTDVATVAPTTTLRDAAKLFVTRHIGGAPVVDGGTVVGVVSASDLLAFQATPQPAPAPPPEPTTAERAELTGEWDTLPGWQLDAPPARFFADGDEDERWTELGEAPPAEHTVAEVMTRRLLALAPAVDVSAAADRMRTARVHRVLVMEHGALLGIVTTSDLARAVADHRITERRFVFDRSPARAGDPGGEVTDDTDADAPNE